MNTRSAFEYLTGEKKFDMAEATAFSLKGAEDGIVLLENRNRALPLSQNETVAFFGRMQKHYLILGTGSGGRVQPSETHDIFTELSSLGIALDKEVEAFYDKFVSEHPYAGAGDWNQPPSQEEPLLDEAFVSSASERNSTAVMVLTRTAGEDRDLARGRGGYNLTETELSNLRLLRKHFGKVVVLLNVCNVIDVSEILSVSPDALLLLWQGGMMGAVAATKVLLGKVNPSGRLPDTMACCKESYPAEGNFGAPVRNLYTEDIYVGYRYFNTFAEDKIIYPFGYGLSYTEFVTTFIDIHRSEDTTKIRAVVSNVGTVAGREVVQCYVNLPHGRLGKPKKILAAFAKTELLQPNESTTVTLTFDDYAIASYDDSGVSGNQYCWVLEEGEYVINLGANASDSVESCSFTVKEDKVVRRCESALAPVIPFNRLVNRNGVKVYEPAPLRIQKEEAIPSELTRTEKDGMTLADVVDGKITVPELVSRFSDEDLIHLVRAEGMSSPKATPGNAAAFGGITPSLKALGLPVMSCIDGPSGLRLVNDELCVCYPSATCLAATWDTALVTDMYNRCGNELASYNIDILLGPGTNIHRDPLGGRNFEYFSEDPLLSGKMAAAICKGLDSAGVSGAVKHFLANNQEFDRYGADSVISERAVREIYAKPFEICVKEGNVRSVMTSYNPVNGRWAASNYELTVRLLRDDYGFDGFVMTDWWAKVTDTDGVTGCVTNLAGMVHAQNDIYMVSPDCMTREDNLGSSLADGSLTRGELQRCAVNLLNFAVDSLSYMAMRSGYGMRDLKAECEGKTPVYESEVSEGKAVINADLAGKAVLRVSFVSDTDVLTQTNVNLNISGMNAGTFIVGGTDGKVLVDHRDIALNAGNNEFVFRSDSPLARAVKIELFI